MSPLPEQTVEQLQAYEIYLNMGDSRSLKNVGRKVDRDPSTISRWRSDYHWDEKVLAANRDGVGTGITATPLSFLVPKPNETVMEASLRTLIESQFKILQEALKTDAEGNYPFKITKLSEFNATVKSFRESVDTYFKLIRAGGGEKGKSQDKLIDLVKMLVEGVISKEDSIGFLKPGQGVPASIPTRDNGTPGSVSEADFEEVPDEGVLDRPKEGAAGSSGVSGSTGETGGGVEGELREPGTLVSLRDFV